MVRHSKIKRGGDISSIEMKLDNIQDEVNELKSELSRLKTNDSSVDETSTSTDIMMPEPISMPETMPESMPVMSDTSLKQQSIEITGYSGTVGDLTNKINKKIKDLNKPTNKGRYTDTVTEYKNLLAQINSASDVNDVKSIIQYKLIFKNNNLMGGKTRKHRKKSKGTKKR